jgi:hypothetical protein
MRLHRQGQAAGEEAGEIEGKESWRWLESTVAAGNLLNGAAQVIVLGDREFGIHAQFARIPARN